MLLLALAGAFLLAGCSGDKEDIPLPVITTEPPVEMPESPDVNRIEWDVVVSGDEAYAVWAQQQSVGAQLYDIFYAKGLIGEDLSALGVNISNSATLDSRDPSIAVDSGGDVCVAWVEGPSPTRSIMVSTRDAISGVFSQPGPFADDAEDSVSPEAHYDSDDTLHLIWAEAGEILHRRRPEGGAASSVTTLPRGDGADPSNPTITSDDDGNVFAIWEQTSPNSRRHLYIASSRNRGVSFLRGDHGWLPSSMLSPGLYKPKAARTHQAQGFVLIYLLEFDDGDVDDRRVRITSLTNFGATLNFTRDVYINKEGIVGTSADIATIVDGSSTQVYVSYVADGQVHLRGSLNGGRNFGEDNALSVGYGRFNTALRTSIGASGDRVAVMWDMESEDTFPIRSGWLTEADISNE